MLERTGRKAINGARSWLLVGSLGLMIADFWFALGFEPASKARLASMEFLLPAIASLPLPILAALFARRIEKFIIEGYRHSVERVGERANYLNVLGLSEIPERMLLLPTPNAGPLATNGRLSELSPLAQLVYIQECYWFWARRDGNWKEPTAIERLQKGYGLALILGLLALVAMFYFSSTSSDPLFDILLRAYVGLYLNLFMYYALLRNLSHNCMHGAICLAIAEQLMGGPDAEDDEQDLDDDAAPEASTPGPDLKQGLQG